MAKIRLNLASLSVSEKLGKARQIVTAMTGNTSFPTPTPPLSGITTAVTELEAASRDAQTARQTAKEKTSVLNLKEDALEQLLTQIAAYVESVAGNNEQLILAAGMDMRAPGVASTSAPAQPQNLAASAGDRDGELDLSWDVVSGAKSYMIQQSPDPVTTTTWAHAAISTRSSYTIKGLTSGTRYWFRVAAVNNNGESGWSDPAMKIAP